MEFILFILLVVLVVGHLRLASRLGAVEEKIAQTRTVDATHVVPPSPPPMPPSNQEDIRPVSTTPPPGHSFLDWWKEDWLVKVGALLLFLGFTWFVSYAFANNWIGPMGRIALGLLCGAGFMVFGWMRMGTLVRQGSIFLALGTGVVVLTTYAARVAYDFFTPTSAIAIMFFAMLFSAMASVRMRTQWLAWMSALLAYVIPLLAASHEVHELQLFTYLYLVTIGVLWVVFLTDWRRIFLTSMTAILLYSLPFWMSGFVEEGGLLIYGYLFVMLFFLANLTGFLTLQKGRTAEVEILGAIGNTVLLSGWTHVGIGAEWQSLVYIAWAIVFLVGAYVFAVRVRRPLAFFVFGGIGVILIGIATALELDGPALTIAFLLESTIAILLSQRYATGKVFLYAAYATFAVPGLLALESLGRFPNYPYPMDAHAGVVFLTVIALWVIGLRAEQGMERSEQETDQVTWGRVFLALGGVFTFVFLWDLLHLIFPDTVATQLSLFASIVAGVLLYVSQQQPTTPVSRALRFSGLLLILFVVGHLLFIEVWQMGVVPRILTFFVVGLVLMGTAFMKKIRSEHA